MPRRPPNKKQELTRVEPVEPVIRLIRGQRVILDSDMAEIYGVPTKVLNQAVKRAKTDFRMNIQRLFRAFSAFQDVRA